MYTIHIGITLQEVHIYEKESNELADDCMYFSLLIALLTQRLLYILYYISFDFFLIIL